MAAILSQSPRSPRRQRSLEIEGLEDDDAPLLANAAPIGPVVVKQTSPRSQTSPISPTTPRKLRLQPKDLLKLSHRYYIYPQNYTPRISQLTPIDENTQNITKKSPIIMKDGYDRNYLYNKHCRIPTQTPNYYHLMHGRMNCCIMIYLWILFAVINLSTINPQNVAFDCKKYDFQSDCTSEGSIFCGDKALCQPLLHYKEGFTKCGCYPNEELFPSVSDSGNYIIDNAVQRANPLFMDVLQNFPEEYPEVKYVTLSLVLLFYIFLGLFFFFFFFFFLSIPMKYSCMKYK